MAEARYFRLKVDRLTHDIMAAMEAVEETDKVSLHADLLELIRVGASQVNGCALFVDAHSKAARDAGVEERRMLALTGWPEAPFFRPGERCAAAGRAVPVDRRDQPLEPGLRHARP